MPYIANTPESALPRSDSRNPATTCRGITNNGRPCRRTLAQSAQPSPSQGVVAVLKGKGNTVSGVDAAAFYCWQHKDQVSQFASNVQEKGQAQIFPLTERSSIDSLVERLGAVGISKGQRKGHPRLNGSNSNGASIPRPQGVKDEIQQSRTSQAKTSRGMTCCCFRIVDNNDDLPASRPSVRPLDDRQERRASAFHRPSAPQQRPVMIRNPHSPLHTQVIQQRPVPTTPERWPGPSPNTPSRQSLTPYHTFTKPGHPATPTRPSLPSTPASSSSQTQPLLSLIPSYLSPQTAALLLTELAKPISGADEDGYIYIFWVTPSTSNSAGPPPSDIANNLLPSPNRPGQHRRTSDALRAAQNRYAETRNSGCNSGMIRLKIGRTSNVHRRLNEWTKQCSHNLTLIRYYPYSSSSPSPSPPRTPRGEPSQTYGRQVPHVHRVERLIHIELADRKVKGQGPCTECGKEHREWFEFEATKDALRLVDESVRRWVTWGERHG